LLSCIINGVICIFSFEKIIQHLNCKESVMKIAVMGTGGMGGYYGGYLASVGHDVTFIARGKHLKAIQQDGLWLIGPGGTLHIAPASATSKPEDIGIVDIVLFCVKLYDTESAAEAIMPIIGKNTIVVSFLNGIDGPERIANIIGPKHVIGAAAYASAVIEKPGVVKYKGTRGLLRVGELERTSSKRLSIFQELFIDTPIDCEISKDIAATLWDKFILLATNSGLSCICRSPVGIVYNDPVLLDLARSMMEEVKALALAQGILVDPNIVDNSISWSKSLPKDLYASMYHDLKQGKRMELDGMSGYVAKLGEQLGVATPCHKTIFSCLNPFKNGFEKNI
jgi:2-dehydropantoate 2-reductase